MLTENKQQKKRILPTLLYGYVVILAVILSGIFFTVFESGNTLKKALVVDSFHVADEILNSINKEIYHHIVDLQDLATGDGLIQLLEDRVKKKQKEQEDLSSQPNKQSDYLKDTSEGGLNKRLRRKFITEDLRQFGYQIFPVVTIFDAQGVSVGSTEDDPEALVYGNGMLEIIKKHGYYFKDIGYLNQGGNKVGVEVVFAVKNRVGDFVGTVRGVIDIRGIIAQASLLLGAHENDELLMLSQEGRLLYASGVFRFFEDHAGQPYFIEIINHLSGTKPRTVNEAVFLKESKKEKIYTYAQSRGHRIFPGFGWILVIARPASEVFEPVVVWQRKLLIICSLLFFLLVIISYFVSRLIVTKETTIIEERNYSDSIINSLPGLVCVCDAQLRLIRWNKNLEVVTGLDGSELYRLNVTDLFVQVSGTGAAEILEKALRDGSIDSELVLQSGDLKPLVFSISGRRYDYGPVSLVVFSGLDISKQKAIQEELLGKTHMLNERIKELDCLYSIQRLTNDDLLGNEAVFQSVADLVPTGFTRPEKAKVRITVDDKQFCSVGFRETKVFIRKTLEADKEVRGAIEVFCTDNSSRQEPSSFLKEEMSLLDDIALKLGFFIEYRQADEQMKSIHKELQRSNKELEQFAYVVSHDLQEPIRMISSYTQLLEQKYRGVLDEKADKFIGYIVEGTTRMHGLIQDLLSFSRISTRGGTLEATDTMAVLENVMANCRLIIEESSANIIYKELPEVSADSSQLLQLFQNLLSNAIKFRGENKPEIIIDATLQNDGRCLFSLRDNGIGIEQKYSEKIFAIFQRLHTREEYPGSGIGLALCRRIVERHGGRIWFESQPGQGTVFYFTLPVAETK